MPTRHRSVASRPPAARSAAGRAPSTSGPVAQLRTTIQHTSGNYQYSLPVPGGQGVVGTSMHAWLDPQDQVDGSDTSQNDAQRPILNSVRALYPGANMVRGHLLNAHLGGDAKDGNLYPISTTANNAHKDRVEYPVKGAMTQGGVEYQVDVVNAVHSDATPNADFRCRAWHWQPGWFGSGTRGAQFIDHTIASRPGAAAAPHGGAVNHGPGGALGPVVHHPHPPGWNATFPIAANHAIRNRGRVSGLGDHGGGYCFITTAVAGRRGLPDDCHELTVLRRFRDTYLAALPQGPAMIRDYYRVAPPILRAIRRRRDNEEILLGLYGIISGCVHLIESGRPAAAMVAYRRMVRTLQRRFLP